MWRKNSVMMTAMKFVLSTMMALPTPSLAKNGNGDELPASTMEGAPVISEDMFDAQGNRASIDIAVIEAKDEVAAFDMLARHNPKGMHVGVADGEDILVKTAIKGGYLNKIKTYFVGDGEKSPLVQIEEKPSVRSRLAEKMKNLTQRCKDSKVGLISSVAYSGIVGSSVWMTSSSVPAGAAIFSMVSALNAFVLLKPETWGKVLRGGGNLGQKLIEGVAMHYGVQASDVAIRAGQLVGRLAVIFTMSAAQVAAVRYFANEMEIVNHGWSNGWATELAALFYFGALNSYNLWDHTILDLYERGKIGVKKVEQYLIAQFILGGALEWANYQNYPYVPVVLFGLTGLGILYQMLNIEQQSAVKDAPLKLKFALRNGTMSIASSNRRALIDRKIGSYRSRLAKTKPVKMSGCEMLLLQVDQLKRRSVSPGGFPLWEDIQ